MNQFDISIHAIPPFDVLPNVFKRDPTELLNRALVCKLWKEVAYSRTLHEMIRPSRAMGLKELKKINPQIISQDSEEAHLPFEVYKTIAEKEEANLKDWWLIYKPSKITAQNSKGEPVDVLINNLQEIGNLCLMKFYKYSCPLTLSREIDEKRSYWVWIELKPWGFSMTYAQQQEIVQSQYKQLYPERYKCKASKDKNISEKDSNKINIPKPIIQMCEVHDVALGIMMGHHLFKESPFLLKGFQGVVIQSKTTIENGEGINKPVSITLTSKGVFVEPSIFNTSSNIGTLCVRKSYPTYLYLFIKIIIDDANVLRYCFWFK